MTIRGRTFTKRELQKIKRITKVNFVKGRTHISKEVCKELDWKQPNGWLKDRACRDVLRTLHSEGVLILPKSKIKRKKKSIVKNLKNEADQNNIDVKKTRAIRKIKKGIELRFAKGNGLESKWNSIVNEGHYLGHKVVVGRCIKYLIYDDDRLLGAISFSSPANRLGPRDTLLKKLFNLDDTEIRDQVINNSRFLILPHVKAKNLASTILSMATKQVVIDWKNYYSVTPLVAETFVQISKFEGTCYKASNWQHIGTTNGYSKKGNDYIENNEPKMIFLYGLNRVARRKLSERNSAY